MKKMKKLLLASLATLSILATALGLSSCDFLTSFLNSESSSHVHTYEASVTLPTCTERGYTTYVCSCGDSYEANYKKAKGHSYSDWIVLKTANCYQYGEERRDCADCDVYETRSIKAVHPYEAVVTEPTCTTQGYTTYICSCGDTYIADYRAANGHLYFNGKCYDCGERKPSEGLEFTLNADGVSYSAAGIGTCKDKDIVIPSTYKNLPVTSIGKEAFAYCSSLTNVTIPKGVTSIGDWAFDGCEALTSVEIPDGVTSIGRSAFSGCYSLVSVELPDSIVSIGRSAFDSCIALTSVEIPDGVTSIEAYTFKSCYSLRSVVIGAGVTSIGDYAFAYCSGLMSFVIPEGVTTIGSYAFTACEDLTNITIPASVTSIGDQAFAHCEILTNVYITDMAAWCNVSFDNHTLNYPTANPLFYAPFLYLNRQLVPGLVVIPKEVTSIGEYAFYNYSLLIGIVLEKSVTSIESYAFSECNNLKDVYYKGTAEEWSEISIRSNNTPLTSATRYYYSETEPTGEGNYWCYDENGDIKIWEMEVLPEEPEKPASEGLAYTLNADGQSYMVTGIGTCEDADIVIPSTYVGLPVTEIKYSAFRNCTGLTSVVIGDNVTKIDTGAFDDCTSLTSVVFGDSVAELGPLGVFERCTSLKSITVSKENAAYQSINGNLYTKDGKTLVQYAIAKTATSFTVPNSVTTIDLSAFGYCQSLMNVVITDNVTTINSSAFYHCRNLMSIVATEGNATYQSIDGNLYTKDGKTLVQYAPGKTATSFTIPDGVTKIGKISDCDYLTSVVIPDSVTEIGGSAFSSCDRLTSVVIGSGVTKIGYSAFGNCDNLKSVYYKGTEEDWNNISINYNAILDGNEYLINATRYYYSETQPTEEGNYWHYDENGEVTVWELPKVVVGDTFEAEYTYLDPDEDFLGFMGLAFGKYSICYKNADGAQICYMGYVYKKGTTITYKINASKAVDNVTLKVNLATVYKTNVTFGPTGEYAWKVAVNGVALDYTPFTYDGVIEAADLTGEFKTYTLSTTVSLKEGENVIEFVTDNTNGVYGTMQGFAPLIDYIQLITKEDVEFSYEPVYENLE